MQPTKVVLQNFLSYGDAEVDLTGLSLAALLGANGAGKSSLVDGITWPLYGEGRYRDIDAYVRQGQEDAVAEIQFLLAGETYRVIRTRSNKGRGKSTLELAKMNGADWVPMSGTGIRETQDKIRDLLRMDYETFVSSCVLLQGEADRFTMAGPTDRMKIFSQIIGLDIYDQLQDAARARARGYRDQAAVKRATMDNLEAELSVRTELQSREVGLRKEREGLERRIRELENDLVIQEKTVSDLRVKAARGEDLEQQKNRIERENHDVGDQLVVLGKKRDRLQQIIDRGDEIRAKATELEKVKGKLTEFEDKASRYLQLFKDAQTLERQVAEFDRRQESQAASIESSLESKRRQAELLDQVPCSGDLQAECRLLKSAREAAAEVAPLQSRLEELNAQQNPHMGPCRKMTEARDAVSYDQAEHQALRDRVPGLEKWARVLPELEQAEDNMAEVLQQSETLQRRRDELLKELRGVTDQLEQMESIATELRRAEAALFGAKQQLSDAQDEAQDVGIKLGTIQAQLKDLEAKAEQKAELEEALAALAKEEHYYTKLARAYKEIPVLIMENALPDVEDLGNELLGRLTGGRISIRFETQKEAKTTGKVSDTLDIIVSDELGERPYEGWSGAERFDVDLSIRLAISKFLAKRAGARIETLIIDEGASCLDADGREHFIEAINEIAKEFKLVLCITHIDELKEHFPQQLIVSKTPEGSHVEVVA
mgnify:CR=1 FL=1